MLQVQLTLNGIATGGLVASLAVGFTLILGVNRFWNLAYAIAYLWSAYLSYLLVNRAGLPFAVMVPIVVLAAAGIGAAQQILVYVPLRRRGATPMTMLIGSLGVYFAGANAAAVWFGYNTEVAKSGLSSVSWRFGALYLTAPQVLAVAVAFVSFVVVQVLLRRTRIGHELSLMSLDPETSLLVGVRPNRARLVAMALGCALAAGPAIINATNVGVLPDDGLALVLSAAVACIVGGIGSITGAFVASFFIGLAETLPLAWLPTKAQDIVLYGILILFILVRPTGFFGKTLWRAHV